MNIVFGLLLLPKVLSHADPFYRSVEWCHPSHRTIQLYHRQNKIKLAPLHYVGYVLNKPNCYSLENLRD